MIVVKDLPLGQNTDDDYNYDDNFNFRTKQSIVKVSTILKKTLW